MKPRPIKNNNTWLKYLSDVSCSSVGSYVASYQEYFNILNGESLSLFYHAVPIAYLLDYSTGKYLTMSDSAQSVLGHDRKKFLDGGLEFTIDQYESKHLNIFNTEIFPDRLSILRNIPPSEHCNYIFSYNLCLRNEKQENVNLLQRNIFIKSDDQGNPLLSLGLVINLDHYRPQNPIQQLVEKVNKSEKTSELIFKKTYYINQEDRLFSKREKEIVFLLADGLTSKEIADKMFISEGTVIIHRKNLLKKSGTLNVASLVAFSIRNQII